MRNLTLDTVFTFLLLGMVYYDALAYETNVHSAISSAAFNQSVLGTG